MKAEVPPIRIRDVAALAGVSPATVSRVLNMAPSVNSVDRARVLTAVNTLGYRPNRLAQNLRRQKTEMIGVVVSDIDNPHFASIVRALEGAAYSLGYRVLLCNTDGQAEKQRSYLEVLAAERVLGVVLSPSNPGGEEIGALLDLRIPVVAFDRPVTDPRADAVVADNRGAAIAASKLLINAGHKHIGFLSNPELFTISQRLAGYEDTMAAVGLRPCSLPGYSRIEEGAAATAELLDSNEDLTALIAGNNSMALGALRALHARKIRVPEEMALVAFDDPIWAAVANPPLTVLAQPIEQMAESMVELLQERIHGNRVEPRRLVVDFELRVRESCGTAR